MEGLLGAKCPIIQGGMALKSSCGLPGFVAQEGGIGVIAITAHDILDIQSMIYQAREIAGRHGVIGINIMAADSKLIEHVVSALETKEVNLVIQGAGISRDIPKICAEKKIPFVPMIARPDQVDFYLKNFEVSAFVFEGKEAGGHLGDLKRSLFEKNDKTLEDIIERAKKVPVIAAGGITPERANLVIKRGARGIQIATSFLLAKECQLSQKAKKIYLEAKRDDVVIMESPAGLPGRALNTNLIKAFKAGIAFPPERYGLKCISCIKKCKCRESKFKESFCIRGALLAAKEGEADLGLFFTGQEIGKFNKETSVKEVMNNYTASLKTL